MPALAPQGACSTSYNAPLSTESVPETRVPDLSQPRASAPPQRLQPPLPRRPRLQPPAPPPRAWAPLSPPPATPPQYIILQIAGAVSYTHLAGGIVGSLLAVGLVPGTKIGMGKDGPGCFEITPANQKTGLTRGMVFGWEVRAARRGTLASPQACGGRPGMHAGR